MFDTVRAKYHVFIPIETFQQLEEEENHFEVVITENLDRKTGELTFRAQIKKHQIPYIVYHSTTATLVFEFSVPKFLYGSNHKLINENGINILFSKLSGLFKELLKFNIDVNEITVNQLHVCHNLDITDTGYTMQEWLSFISKKKLPWKPKKMVYYDTNNLTGVTFTTRKGKNSITFYNKEAEMINNDNSLSNEGKNLLRVEIRTGRQDREKYGSNKITDLLTTDYFCYIVRRYKVNELLKVRDEELEQLEIPYFYLIDQQIYKIYQIERIAGHIKINNDLQEQAESLYEGGTYNNRQKELKAFFQLIQKPIKRKLLQVEL